MTKRFTLLVALLSIAPFLEACRCPVVQSGHRGIVFKTLGGGTSQEVLGEGMHFMPIWNDVISYDTRIHEMKEQLAVLSNNGLTLRVDASVRFRPKVKSYPTVTNRAESRPRITVRANSSGPIPPISPVNDSTTRASIPISSIRAAFSSGEVIS